MRILGSLFFFALFIWADFRVFLQQNPIIQGEPAKLVLEANGSDITLPKIERIGPYPVAGVTQNEQVVEENGNLVVQKSEIVIFYPDRNLTIPSFEAVVDGQKRTSQPVQLIVLPAAQNKSVQFTLKLDKKEAYVGEPIIAELVLKLRRNLGIVDYSFTPPKFDGFWVKEIKSGHSEYLEEHGLYLIKRLRYLLLPQKPGVLRVSPAIFKYAIPDHTTDAFGFSITAPRWKSVISNSASVVVKPLPKPVDLVGDFTITIKVDKIKAKPNEPINVDVVIEGKGNLENLDKIPLTISGVTLYEDKPKLSEQVKKDGLYSRFEQHFSIIADHSFTIPPLLIDYFSLKEKRLKKLTAKKIDITILSQKSSQAAAASSTPSSSKPLSAQKSRGDFWIGLVVGAGGTLLVLALVWLARRIRRPKFAFRGKKALLNRLLPYIDKDKEAAAMAEALYKEIYEGKKHRISSKKIKALLKRLES